MRTLGGFTFPCDAPVFVRVDFNVPMDEVGTITDDLRIRASLPTIESLLGRGAPLILISHLGRPVKNEQQGFSLKPCAERLSEYIGVNVPLVDFLDLDTKLYGELTRHLDKSGIVLFENIRFFAEETSKAQADRRILAEQLAPLRVRMSMMPLVLPTGGMLVCMSLHRLSQIRRQAFSLNQRCRLFHILPARPSVPIPLFSAGQNYRTSYGL